MGPYQKEIEKAQVLIEALPYIQSFRDTTVVIKYGGSAMEEESLMDAVLRDIVFLEAVGINPVVVHGGGKAITARMEERGLRARFVEGFRVTDAETIGLVEDVLENVLNPKLVEKIVQFGGQAQQISGKKVFHAQKTGMIQHGSKTVDLGFVGDIISCSWEAVKALVDQQIVPVVTPLGSDHAGQAYNINADIAAAEAAIWLKALKIIYISDVNGILSDENDPKSTISSVNEKQIQELRKRGIITGGMLPKVDACLRALKSGVKKVHLIDGRIPHALLLELFTDSGIGTEITL